MSAQIAAITLNVRDPEHLAQFYCSKLGMHRVEHGSDVAVGYGGDGAALVFRPAIGDYEHQPHDRYWKIAITLPDLDLAHAQLLQNGVSATDPHQFRDIAYLCHLADPEGFVIELLQHTFQNSRGPNAGDPALPLGGGAQIGLITLRSDDIRADLARCRNDLGMVYLSRQDVSAFGFDLHFLAFTAETPPVPDIDSVQNREWLWQRPYTVLEFQNRLDGKKVHHIPPDTPGAASVSLKSTPFGDLDFR